MRRTLAIATGLLLLVGCGNVALPTRDEALQERLKNPLYAEYYYDDLTAQMVTLALQDDPLLQEPGMRDLLDRTRNRSLEHANIAMEIEKRGRNGNFISDRELVSGEALLVDNVLYFGPTFDSAPGPSLSVYLTTSIDPRDSVFPDDTAVRLGTIKDQYGAQSFVVPETEKPTGTGAALRTAVLWDDSLHMLYGFAQLSFVAK